MSEERPKSWGFVPIDVPATAIRLFKEGFKHRAPVLIWTKDQDTAYHSKLSSHQEAEKSFFCNHPKEEGGKKFADEITSKDSPECYVCITLPLTTLFFKTNYLGSQMIEGVQFAVPEKIFKVQRRKAQRWEIRPGYVMKAEFEDPAFPGTYTVKKIIDVSSGGIGIIISPEEEGFYTGGTELKNIKFKVKTTVVKATGRVKHSMILPATSSYRGSIKVGISFDYIHVHDKKVIDNYVLEEMVKFNARFL